jgi:hypothetical protein
MVLPLFFSLGTVLQTDKGLIVHWRIICQMPGGALRLALD